MGHVQDLDLTKPFVRRERRDEFCVTTAEVLSKADFRVSLSHNVCRLCSQDIILSIV